MAQLTGPNLYRVRYKVVTPTATVVDPPAVVGSSVVIAVLAASVAAAAAVATTAAGLTGSQTIRFSEIEQQPEYSQIWQ